MLAVSYSIGCQKVAPIDETAGDAYYRRPRPDERFRTVNRPPAGRTARAMADETAPRTVVFFPEGAFGPTNNCIGIANVLRQRGHRVVFVVEESFAGTLAVKGFEERLMRLQAPPEVPEEPGQFWKDFIRDTA